MYKKKLLHTNGVKWNFSQWSDVLLDLINKDIPNKGDLKTDTSSHFRTIASKGQINKGIHHHYHKNSSFWHDKNPSVNSSVVEFWLYTMLSQLKNLQISSYSIQTALQDRDTVDTMDSAGDSAKCGGLRLRLFPSSWLIKDIWKTNHELLLSNERKYWC